LNSKHKGNTDESRISTGNRQADEILGGGFPKNSINVIMGQPGTGKTVFAENLVFHNADGDRPILYLTTLSEPQNKMLTYVQRFSFYQEDKVGTAIIYDDIGSRVSKEGIKSLPQIIREAIRSIGPKLIVIDSFKALHDLAPSVLEMRQMLHEMAGILTAYQTTVFLVGEYTDEHARELPEFAVADGIIQLLRSQQSTRDERFLRVLKLRGSAYLEGLHGFKIKPDGLEVYPRLVTPEIPETYTAVEEQIPWGVDGMDKLLDGGLWRGSTTLLAGPTGSGKTTMALQFALKGVSQGEPSLYVHFQENPVRLAKTIRSLGTDLEQVKQHGLQLLYVSPVELQIDSVVVSMFRRVREQGIRRIVLDAVGDLILAASDRQRLHDYLYAMIQHFNVNGVTSLLVWETVGKGVTSPTSSENNRFSFMSDNIVLLSMNVNEKAKRSISVLKARGTANDLGIHEFEITKRGARIEPGA